MAKLEQFKKGKPKTGGRKKGVVNKSTVAIRDILDRRNINLIEEILDAAEQCDPFFKAKILSGLLPYVYPRLTSIEHRLAEPPKNYIDVKKSFDQFCLDTGYPKPYPKQLEMVQFGMRETVARLLLGSRGYGKTEYVVILGVAYEIYCDSGFRVLLVTKSEERNAAMLGEMAHALEVNGVTLEKDTAQAIRVQDLLGPNHSVSAITLGSSTIRGRHPDLVVLEDIVTPEDCSEATRKKAKRVYDEVSKLCKNVLVIGQPVHKFDLFQELRTIIKVMEVPHGSIPELDHDLIAQRLAGISEETIQASYFLKIVAGTTSPLEKVNYIDTFPPGDSIAFIDPSFKGGDYTALSIIKGHFDGVAVHGKLYKKAWNHCVEEMAKEMKANGVKRVAFECNSLGDTPVAILRLALGSGIGVVGADTTDNKHAKIMALGPFAHLIHLSKTSDKIYIDQCVQYEYGAKHDDAPDSLASGLKWLGLIKVKK